MTLIKWICQVCGHAEILPTGRRDMFRVYGWFQCDQCKKETVHKKSD